MPISDYNSALITGASSGIGEELVRILTAKGLTVHAAARRAERLEALSSDTGCIPCVIDLTDTAKLYETLGSLDIDILVNNAGVGLGFDALRLSRPEDIDKTIEINVRAAIHVVRATMPKMVDRQRGHIVNIGSVASLYPLLSPLYGASKAAIHLLSQNLRIELKGTGIRCTEISPGRVRTEFFEQAIDDPKKASSMLEGYQPIEPSDIATAVEFALEMPWNVNIGHIEMTPTEQIIGGAEIVPSKSVISES